MGSRGGAPPFLPLVLRPPSDPSSASDRTPAKLRSAAPLVPARLEDRGDGRAGLRLAEPQFGVAPGQAAVFYAAEDPDRLLGGGWIAAAPTMADAA